MAFPLVSGQFTTVSLTGLDAFSNSAPATLDSFVIDDHAKAYAVQQGGNVVVVARGPVGNFHLTVNAKSAAGNTLTASQDFTVSGADAVQVVLSLTPASGNLVGVPPAPTGW